jgi:outer membrane protein OmpA-like peptidoglycan-associated protein
VDDNDDGARIGLWVTLSLIALLLFGLLFGLALRQAHPAQRPITAAAAQPAPPELAVQMAAATHPPAAVAPLQGEPLARLFFDSGSAQLPAGAGPAIDAAARALAGAPAGTQLVLSGFHDTTGDAAANAELAKQRALVVSGALMSAGVDPGRVVLRKPETTAGGGRPEEARRVELRLVAP